MRNIFFIILLSITVSAQNILKETAELTSGKIDSKENLPSKINIPTFNLPETKQNFSFKTLSENGIDSVVYWTTNDLKFKSSYEFDSESRIIKEISYQWIENRWLAKKRNTREYDVFGNTTLNLNEQYNNSNWVYIDKEISAYDNMNNLLYQKRYNWGGHMWLVQNSWECEYSSSGNLTKIKFEQNSSDEKWMYEYFYDNQQRDTLIISYNWEDGNYIYERKWTYDYQDDYYTKIKTNYIWEDENWKIDLISYQILDENEHFLEEKFERWNNGTVEASYLHQSDYDKWGNRLSSKSYEYKNDSLELYFEAEYQYDENGFQIFATHNHYEDKLLIDADRYTSTYEDSIETSTIYEKWDGTSWKVISASYYNYNAQSKILSYKYEQLEVETNQTRTTERNYNYNFKGNLISVANYIKEGNSSEEKRITELSYDSNDKLITVMNYKLVNGVFIENDDYYYTAEIPGYINMGYSELYIYHKNGDPIVRNDQKLEPQYRLFQNFPNPFNPETTISFSVSKQSEIRITLFNSIGEEIEKIVSGDYMPGTYYVPFKNPAISSGIYFYRLETDNTIITKKMIILK